LNKREHKNACNASLMHDISFKICKKAICIIEERKDVNKYYLINEFLSSKKLLVIIYILR